MGRPIDPRKTGNTTVSGHQIRVYGILDINTGIEALYIKKQVNAVTYLCADPTDTRTGRITLQEHTPTLVGQGRLAVFPYGASGATATANMKAVSAVMVAAGTGYTVSDLLTVTGGTGTKAKITVDTVNGSGVILTSHISTAGNYSALPSNPVSVTGGTGTGATFTMGYGVNSIAVTAGGAGYEDAPTVTITGGSSATAHAVITNGAVSSIVVDTAGSGFTSLATVTIGKEVSFASGVEQHLVKTFEGTTYQYDINVSASQAGHADIDVA